MLDEKSLEIICTIAAIGSGSPEEIAAETGIPKSTVHYRISQLREAGVIKNDLFEIDLSAVGLTMTVISEVYAEFGERYHEEVGEQLADIESVNQVYFTMGDTDFIVIAHLPDRESVEQLIDSYQSIPKIDRTSSRFVIKTVEGVSNPLGDFDADTLISELIDDRD